MSNFRFGMDRGVMVHEMQHRAKFCHRRRRGGRGRRPGAFSLVYNPTQGPTVPDSRGGAKMQRCQDLKSGIDVGACWERVSDEDGRRAVRADE